MREMTLGTVEQRRRSWSVDWSWMAIMTALLAFWLGVGALLLEAVAD